MQFSTYSLILIIAFFLSLSATFLALRRKTFEDSRQLFYLGLSVSVWLFFGILASMSVTVAWKMFFSKWEYFGIATAPTIYLIYILKYTHTLPHLKRWHIVVLFTIPALTILSAFTNQHYHLLWREVTLAYNSISLSTGYYYAGPSYWVIIGYCYVSVATALFVLLRASVKYPHQYSSQIRIIIFSVLLPIAANVLYSFMRKEFNGVDFTPVAFAISEFLMLLGIGHFGLLQVKPYARDFLFESMQDGVLFVGVNQQIIDINSAARRIFSISESDTTITRIKRIEETNPEINAICKLFPNIHVEMRIPEVSGKFFDVTVHALNDYKDQAVGKVIVLRDITSQQESKEVIQKQKEELEVLNQQKDKIFSILSHDLRSPLVSIIGAIEAIRAKDVEFTDEERLIVINSFLNRTKVTLELVENILQWAKSQRIEIQSTFENIDLPAQVDEVVRVYSYMATDKGINIEVCPNDRVQPLIYGSNQFVTTILRNLVTNAIKFTPEGGMVHIKYQYCPEYCLVSVSDTGVGISPRFADKLFNEFKSLYTSGTNGEKGSGLGLFLCKELVEKMGGKIWIESEAGKGTNVLFYLPYAIAML